MQIKNGKKSFLVKKMCIYRHQIKIDNKIYFQLKFGVKFPYTDYGNEEKKLFDLQN